MKLTKSLFQNETRVFRAGVAAGALLVILSLPFLTQAQVSCEAVLGSTWAPRTIPQLTTEQWDALAAQQSTALSKAFDDTSLPAETMGYFNFTDPGGLFRPSGDSLEPFYGDALHKSITEPVELSVGLSYRFGGGPVLFDGHVYPNEFFVRNLHSKKGLAKTNFWQQVIAEQPVLKLEQDQQSFSLAKNENASIDILQSLVRNQGSQITIYRGTTNLESAMNEMTLRLRSTAQVDFTALHDAIKLQRNYLSSQKRVVVKTRNLDQLEAAVNEIEAAIKADPSTHAQKAEVLARYLKALWRGGDFGAAFTTDSHDKAVTFTKGSVVQYTVPAAQLIELVKSSQVYVGIEGQVEMAFITDAAQTLLLNSFRGSEAKKAEGSIW